MAGLRASNQILPASNPQSYGVLPANGPVVFGRFTFSVDAVCGEKVRAELELRDAGSLVGTLPFEFTVGSLVNGVYTCCSSADLSVSVTSSPEPAALSSPLSYIITVVNQGPSAATGVMVTNRLSALVQLLATSSNLQEN